MARRRFLVVDLGEQLRGERRFAVWDHETERFWKINNCQTWRSVAALLADVRAKDRPEPQIRATLKATADEIVVLATLAGFDLDD